MKTEQWTIWNEQRIMSKKQCAMNNEQWTTNHES